MAQSTTESTTSKQAVPPGMVLGPDGKPCKVCTGFRAWAGIPGKRKEDSSSSSSSSTSSSSPGGAAFAGAATATGTAASSTTTSSDGLPRDCPADVERLGRHTWTFLHTTASYYPPSPSPSQKGHMLSLLRSLPVLYPCGTCAGELGTYMGAHPPDRAVESRDKLEKWLCEVHNEVNERLGKERFDCDRVGERWRDGWSDGRCHP